MVKLPELRTYKRQDCIVFRKTSEKFGGLSNMAAGYPLLINGIMILTSEALYQACRFPHLPEVQELIIAERSPMTAKMKSKPYRDNSRFDWDKVRTKIMRWCLQVKLVQNWEKFSKLLLETENLPIVENSKKDDFWGAKPQDQEIFTGANVLGRLLMELREQVKNEEITSKKIIIPLSIPNFLLYGQEINPVSENDQDYLDTNVQVNKIDSKLVLDTVLPNNYIYDNVINNEKNLVQVVTESNKYDAFYIMLPYIETLLKNERTDKELATIVHVPLNLMRSWLKRAVKLGRVKKLSKPVRYLLEPQLPLFDSNFGLEKLQNFVDL